MPEIYLLDISGYRFGVRKEEVASVRPIDAVHRLPFSPDGIAGLAFIDKRRTVLADLPALLGLPPFTDRDRAWVIFGADQGNETGFLVADDPAVIKLEANSFQQMPDYIATPAVPTCINYLERPVPIIDLKTLYRLVNEKKLDPSLPSFPLPPPMANLSEPRGIRLFTVGGETFAFLEKIIDLVLEKPPEFEAFPSTPSFVKGLIFAGDALIPVIDVAKKIHLPQPAEHNEKLMSVQIGGNRYGFLIDSCLEDLPENQFTLYSLPPLAKSPLIEKAAVYAGEIIPLLEPRAILDNESERRVHSSTEQIYSYNSQFGREFNHQDVEVLEFILLGERHALPKSEVEDIFPIRPFRNLPGLQSLVIGITLHQDELVPIVDPALVFGRYSPINENWKMILVGNGDFRAFIVSEATFPDRTLPLSIHKKIPLNQPDSLVYGCYPDDNRVRLVINAAALATHFDKSGVKSFLSSHTSWMTGTLKKTGSLAEIETKALLPERPAQFPERGQTVPDMTDLLLATETEEEIPFGHDRDTSPFDSQRQEIPPENIQPEENDIIPASPSAFSDEEIIILDHPEEPILYEDIPAANFVNAESASTDDESSLSRLLTDSLDVLAETDNHPGHVEEIIFQPETLSDSTLGGNENLSDKLDAVPIQIGQQSVAMPLQQNNNELFNPGVSLEKPNSKTDISPDLTRLREIMAQRKRKEDLRKSAAEQKSRPVEKPAESVPEPLEIKGGSAKPRHDTDIWREFEDTLAEPPPLTANAEQFSPSSDSFEIGNLENSIEQSPFPASQRSGKNRFRLPVLIVLLLLITIDALIFLSNQVDKKPALPPVAVVPKTAMIAQHSSEVDDRSAITASSEEVKTETVTEDPSKVEAELEPIMEIKEKNPPLTMIVSDRLPLTKRIYTVQEGDTLWEISMRFTGTPYNYQAMARENNIANPDLIYPDQPILLKRESRAGIATRTESPGQP